MVSPSNDADRHASLQLLEYSRRETDGKRKQLESRQAFISALSATSAEEILTRLLATSPYALVEFFRDHRLRVAGKSSLDKDGPPSDIAHDADPEIIAAVERLNFALYGYDRALLELRFVAFFDSCVTWEKSGVSRNDSKAFIALLLFKSAVSSAKEKSFHQSLGGEDIQTLDQQNMLREMTAWLSFYRDKKQKTDDSAISEIRKSPQGIPCGGRTKNSVSEAPITGVGH